MGGRRLVDPPRRGTARVALLLLCLATLAACAGLRGGAPEERAITVELPVARAEAVRRTLAAFRAQGYRVRETLTSGSAPETEPFSHGEDVEAVFRAAITGSANSARVVLTGTYRRHQLGGLLPGREHEVRRSDDPLERDLWARLYNVSLTLRRRPAR